MAYLLIISILLGPLIYLKVAASFHFVILGSFVYIVLNMLKNNTKIKISKLRRLPMLRFFLFWISYSVFTLLWASDKMLVFKYSYNIGLLFLVFVIFQYSINTPTKFYKILNFMVLVLTLINFIGIWEIMTGNHILANYLENPARARMLRFTPGGFFMNPNDNAMYVLQILPFSLINFYNEKNYKIKYLSRLNIFLSPIIIAATGSRTMFILCIIMLFLFALPNLKKKSIRRIFTLSIILLIITTISINIPLVNKTISKATDEVRISNLMQSIYEEGGSGNIRVNLTLNSIKMMINSYGFGVGAGNHRVLMYEYSSNYYYTGTVAAAHNLLAEILADYGIFVFALFVFSILKSIKILNIKRKNYTVRNQKIAYILLISNVIFVIAAIGSSSIIQIPALWIMLALTNTYLNLDDTSKFQFIK